MAQNDKKFCLLHTISREPSITWSWFMLHVCKMVMSPSIFFIFQSFDFSEGQVMTQNCQFQSVTFHISGTVNHIIKILGTQVYLMIPPGVSHHFFKKCNIVNIKNSHVFYWPTSTVLLINSCFSSSSINAKK